jgi:glycosyltransferase involved in cell wall biosynthesis
MVLQDLVDVIIPSYQETHLLMRAIDSALSQGPVVNNIFVVDDGSDESTRLFISKYVEPKAKVRVLYSNRANHPGIARNIGLEHCTSEWVAFLDADDVWMADKLEKQLLFAEKFAFDFVASNATVHDSTPTVKEYFDPHTSISLNPKSLVMDNQVINSTTIVKLNSILKIGGYARDYHLRGVEDHSTWLRLSTICKMGYLEESLVVYSFSNSSFSRSLHPVLPIYSLVDFFFWLKLKKQLSLRLFLLSRIIKFLVRRENWREG